MKARRGLEVASVEEEVNGQRADTFTLPQQGWTFVNVSIDAE